jgi:hypothetical protein
MLRTAFLAAALVLSSCSNKPSQYSGVVCPKGAWIEVNTKQYAGAVIAYCTNDSFHRHGPYAIWDRVDQYDDLSVLKLQRLEGSDELFVKSVEGFYRGGYRCGRHTTYINGRASEIEFYDYFENLTDNRFFYDEKGVLRQVGAIEKGDVDEIEWQRLAATAPTIGVISAEELAYCAD